jgi:hypothetical protein
MGGLISLLPMFKESGAWDKWAKRAYGISCFDTPKNVWTQGNCLSGIEEGGRSDLNEKESVSMMNYVFYVEFKLSKIDRPKWGRDQVRSYSVHYSHLSLLGL